MAQPTESPWFSHDANARRNEKLIALKAEYGMEGYGMWWALVEVLRAKEDRHYNVSRKFAYGSLADELSTNREGAQKFVETCIELELLETDGVTIWCKGLEERLAPMEAKREKRRRAALKQWSEKQIEKCNAPEIGCNAPENESNAHAMLPKTDAMLPVSDEEESRVEESRVEESISGEGANAPRQHRFKPPSEAEVQDFFREKQCANADLEASKFWNFYDSKGWKVGPNKMQKWRSAAAGWITRSKAEGVTANGIAKNNRGVTYAERLDSNLTEEGMRYIYAQHLTGNDPG